MTAKPMVYTMLLNLRAAFVFDIELEGVKGMLLVQVDDDDQPCTFDVIGDPGKVLKGFSEELQQEVKEALETGAQQLISEMASRGEF